MKTYTKRTYSNQQLAVDVSFGVKDRLGREIGAKAFYADCEVTLEPEGTMGGWPIESLGLGHHFAMTTSATRAGKSYGASQSPTFYATAKDRDDALAKYLKDARKRAEKRAGK